MRLGLDFETSDLWKGNLPPDHPSQPHIAQIGAILFDPQWKVVSKLVCLIRPEGWGMAAAAEAHHGISEERAAQFGIPIVQALLVLKCLYEASLQVFVHNAGFERMVLAGQLAKLNADDLWVRKKGQSTVCTMQLATEPCALPHKDKNIPGFKFPTLAEALKHYDPTRTQTTAHEAEQDVMDAALLAQYLQRDGLWPDVFRPGFRSE